MVRVHGRAPIWFIHWEFWFLKSGFKRHPSSSLSRLHQGGVVSGSLCQIPDAQHINWVGGWLRDDNEGIYVGVSMSILNSDLYDECDFPSVETRSVLDQVYQVSPVYGHNRVVFNYLSVIENPDPSGPQYTLLLTEDQGQLKGLVMKSISILMTHLLIMIYPIRIIPCLMNNMVKMVQIC